MKLISGGWLRVIAILSLIVTILGCVYRSNAHYNDDKPAVRGLVVDTSGHPVAGATIYAVHRKHVVPEHCPECQGAWTQLVGSDSFVTSADGHYDGRLNYRDGSRADWRDDYVFYFACKDGFRPLRLFLPERGVVVMRRVSEHAYEPFGIVDADWVRAEREAGCSL